MKKSQPKSNPLVSTALVFNALIQDIKNGLTNARIALVLATIDAVNNYWLDMHADGTPRRNAGRVGVLLKTLLEFNEKDMLAWVQTVASDTIPHEWVEEKENFGGLDKSREAELLPLWQGVLAAATKNGYAPPRPIAEEKPAKEKAPPMTVEKVKTRARALVNSWKKGHSLESVPICEYVGAALECADEKGISTNYRELVLEIEKASNKKMLSVQSAAKIAHDSSAKSLRALNGLKGTVTKLKSEVSDKDATILKINVDLASMSKELISAQRARVDSGKQPTAIALDQALEAAKQGRKDAAALRKALKVSDLEKSVLEKALVVSQKLVVANPTKTETTAAATA